MNGNRILSNSVKSIDMTEMNNLEKYLSDSSIPFFRRHFNGVYDGDQIIVYDEEGNRVWDAVCHRMSYGGKDGLLEIMGTIVDNRSDGDSVVGHLKAEDVIKRIEDYARRDG